MAEIFEVSQINEYLRQRFEADEFLGSLLIRGELSNYKIYPSGHHYFTLKDSQSAIRCVMFKGSAMRLRFRPETGMKVIAGGRIAVFPRDGAYQLYCTSLTPEGVGDLHVAFEQLKLKLQAEGLFARERKQALPRFPHRIAIITSSAGAALHDMLRILSVYRGPRLRRRSPGRSATPTAGSWPTSSSPDAAAAPWRTCGPSTTNAWPAPLPIRIFRSSRPSVMSQM